MKRSSLRPALMALAVIAASCSSGTDATTAPTTAPPETATTTTTTATNGLPSSTGTTLAPSDTGTTTTEAPPPSSTLPPPTLPAPGEPGFAMSQVIFGEGGYVAITNVGSGEGSTDGLWLCQFPAYVALPAVNLQAGEVLALAFGSEPISDVIGVAAMGTLDGRVGDIARSGGELGLYSANTFNDANAILDYVEWGESGHARSTVAVEAGMWVDGGFVFVSEEALALLAGNFPTLGPGGWTAEIGG